MACDVEFTDEFGDWWEKLSSKEQISIAASVELLEDYGTKLPYSHSSGVNGSRHGHMRELRIQHECRPYRILYAFDPIRTAILLIGGDKTGNDRWYKEFIPVADDLYDEHIALLKKEGLIHGKKL